VPFRILMPKSGRRPGGQPGNRNALKHGFYSKLFKPGELDDLNAVLADGLTDEIAMLRVVVRRLFALAVRIFIISPLT
jgi:hypothetical protein